MSHGLFDGALVRNVHVFGQTIDIWVKPRTEEIERRAAVGVGAILDEGHVRALMTIPEGTPVALRTVGGGLLLELEGLLEVHAVEIVGDAVRRRAVPPVDLVGFAKFVNDWSDLRGLSLLRTHGPRFAVASPVSAGADSAGGRRRCWCGYRYGT